MSLKQLFFVIAALPGGAFALGQDDGAYELENAIHNWFVREWSEYMRLESAVQDVPENLSEETLHGEYCFGPNTAEFMLAYKHLHGEFGEPDIRGLVSEISRARDAAEQSAIVGEGLGRDLVFAARLDGVLGSWIVTNPEFTRVDSPERRAERALLQRVRCRIAGENIFLLEDFLSRYGFPSEQRFGQDVASSAMLILKHAPDGSEVIDTYYALAEASFEQGEMSPFRYATLLDTVARFRDEPLIFGTYVVCGEDGPMVSGELADPDTVNVRRAEFGLPPLELHLAQLEPICAAHN